MSKASLDVIRAFTTSLLSLQYVRGASLERKMRLPPAETGYKRKILTMNILFEHIRGSFRRKLCIFYIVIDSEYFNLKTNESNKSNGGIS